MYYKEKMLLCKQAEKGTDTEPLEQVQYDTEYNVFANEKQHSEQLESISNTCVVEKVDSIVIPDSPDICDNVIQTDQNVKEYDDKRVVLANLIANLKVDIDEDKKIQKQLKKANASMTQELKGCKSILAETSMTLGESNSIRDSCLIALQSKQAEFETYKTLNDLTVDYDKLERKLNKTIGLLAQKEIDIKEGLKLKAYEISVVKEKQDELVKKSLLTKSHYEGLVKEKINVITDLKLKEEKDIDKMISMEKQLKFLKEIVYQKESINSNHSYIPYDPSDLANRFTPDREETLTLEKESRSKMNKDLVKPYDYIKQNSLYEIFKPAIQEYHDQLAHANEGNDLITGNCGSDLYTICLQETTSSTPICLMAKASPTQAWLWHRRLSYLNFDYVNLLSKKDIVISLPKLKYVKDQLCSSCELSKAKRSSFKTKVVPSSKHCQLFGKILKKRAISIRVSAAEELEAKKLELIVNRIQLTVDAKRLMANYGVNDVIVVRSRFNHWQIIGVLRIQAPLHHCNSLDDILPERSIKDETPKVIKDFLKMIQCNLQAQVIFVRTDRGIEFLNKTLHAYFKEEGIEHQTSTPQTPEQNGVVKRQNRTLVEAARMMLSASKLPLFFWAEAIATACYNPDT
ncbi:retrovirus-related pol polyprotein from transposon TNT 1-94 [Tanacetum coccineum]